MGDGGLGGLEDERWMGSGDGQGKFYFGEFLQDPAECTLDACGVRTLNLKLQTLHP